MVVISAKKILLEIRFTAPEMNQNQFLAEKKDFSIVLGGPFFQLLRKAHLTGDALELAKRRLVTISLLAWLPLMLLSAFEGRLLPGSSKLPFLMDVDVHIRFLVALPLLILAELIVHQRLVVVIRQFQHRKLISDSALGLLDRALHSSVRLRDSVVAEIGMVVLIYVIGYQLIWSEAVSVEGATAWYHSTADLGELSMAGTWFRWVSLPIWQFLFLRWYYRIFIWSRFLFLVARIPMNLHPTHPDCVGGLGFLENTVHAFKPIAFAHGVILAGMISNNIFYGGASLLDYKIPIALITLWVALIAIGPLMAFAGVLADVKRKGILDFGLLASRFTGEFEAVWMKDKLTETSSKPGSDIQSLADLANSHAVVVNMKFIPISRSSLISIVVITLVPVAPLVLTMMPLNEALKMLMGILF